MLPTTRPCSAITRYSGLYGFFGFVGGVPRSASRRMAHATTRIGPVPFRHATTHHLTGSKYKPKDGFSEASWDVRPPRNHYLETADGISHSLLNSLCFYHCPQALEVAEVPSPEFAREAKK